jgi:hypothetical protein
LILIIHHARRRVGLCGKKNPAGGFFSPSDLRFRLCKDAAPDPRSPVLRARDADFAAGKCPIKKSCREAAFSRLAAQS